MGLGCLGLGCFGCYFGIYLGFSGWLLFLFHEDQSFILVNRIETVSMKTLHLIVLSCDLKTSQCVTV